MVNGLLDVLPLLPAPQRERTLGKASAVLTGWWSQSKGGAAGALLRYATLKNGPGLLNSAPAVAAYLLRAQVMASAAPSYDNASDLRTVDNCANTYLGSGYPDHMADGTPSRNDTGGQWPGEKDGDDNVVWGDDSFMSSVLLARRAASLPAGDASARRWLAYIVKTQLSFREHLLDPQDGLYRHAFNRDDGHHSCCKWGRANGWILSSHVEILLAAKAQVAADGTVHGICQGGPIKGTVAECNACNTTYAASVCGGLGFTLRAAAAMQIVRG